MHTSHIGLHLFVQSLCGIIFLVQKMSYKVTKSELLVIRIFLTLKSNWWGWQFVLSQEIIKRMCLPWEVLWWAFIKVAAVIILTYFYKKKSHIKWDFQILLNINYSTSAEALNTLVLEHLKLMRLTPARFKIGFNRKQEKQLEVNGSISAQPSAAN